MEMQKLFGSAMLIAVLAAAQAMAVADTSRTGEETSPAGPVAVGESPPKEAVPASRESMSRKPLPDKDNLSLVPVVAKNLSIGEIVTPAGDHAAPEQREDAGKNLESANVKSRYQLNPGSGLFLKNVSGARVIPGEGTGEGVPGGDIVVNFEGADIREVVKALLGGILKENYIIDPKVQGTVNVSVNRALPPEAVLPTLETLLRMNGAAMVREQDGVFRILPMTGAIKGTLTPQLGGTAKPLPAGYSVQIVPLQFVGAREMARVLEPFTPDNAVVRVDDARNLLLLAGGKYELRHLLETVEMFDADWMSGMSVGLFPLKYIDVKAIAPEIEKLFGEKAVTPVAGIVRVIPIEKMNSVLVVTTQPKYLEIAKTWVERMDRGGTEGSRIYVYAVQNGKADRIAAVLGQLYGGKTAGATGGTQPATVAPGAIATEIKSAPMTQAQPGTGGLGASSSLGMAAGGGVNLPAAVSTPPSVTTFPGSSLRVVADKDNNALLIYATPTEYEEIETALKKLDVVPRQVLVEVTIAEVNLSDEYSYGLEWYFNNGARRQEGQLDMNGVKQRTPGFSFAWKDSVGGINAVLNALANDSRLNIISSPHIMVADNQTAKIQVGDRVPTTSQTQAVTGTTTGVISSIQYLDTGILLSVTPHINAGGLVSMEIAQEVSNATKTVTSGIDSPTISKRTAQSSVTVQSGEVIVLGGLIKEENSNGSSGIPLLSEIPVLGALFGTQTKKKIRTELLILITPKVAGNNQETREITDELRRKMSGVKLDLTRMQQADFTIDTATQ